MLVLRVKHIQHFVETSVKPIRLEDRLLTPLLKSEIKFSETAKEKNLCLTHKSQIDKPV